MKQVLDLAKRFFTIFTENRLTMAASALSYSLTMTFFPMVIVLYSLLGNNYVKAMRVLAFVEHLMSEETVSVIRDFLVYVSTDRSPAMLAAGVTVLVTSSSSAARSLLETIGRMQGGSRFRGVGAFLFSVVFSVLLVVGVYVVMIIMLAGRELLGRLNSIIPIIDLSGSWDSVRFLIMGGIELLLFWGIYLVTQKKGEHFASFPGAILATLATVAVSYGFSAIIGASVRYPLVYGSLASLILLMMWLYFSSLVIYCGAALNVALRDRKREKQIM